MRLLFTFDESGWGKGVSRRAWSTHHPTGDSGGNTEPMYGSKRHFDWGNPKSLITEIVFQVK